MVACPNFFLFWLIFHDLDLHLFSKDSISSLYLNFRVFCVIIEHYIFLHIYFQTHFVAFSV